MSARLLQVIEATTTRGRGTEDDPLRCVTEFFTADGELLAVADPVKEQNNAAYLRNVYSAVCSLRDELTRTELPRPDVLAGCLAVAKAYLEGFVK